jgi:acetyl esterase/lipase
MKTNNRRDFIRTSALGIAAASIGSLPASAANKQQAAVDIEKKTVYLWPDGSPNNGPVPEKRPKLEFFIPKGNGTPRAAIMVTPGGGYGSLSLAKEGASFAEFFAKHGIVSAVLNYRVAPNRYPGPIADGARGMRLFRSMATELNIDPQKLGMIGFSAGGHLASTMGTQPDVYKDPVDNLVGSVSARPNKLMLGYPVISFEEYYGHVGSAKNLLGPGLDPPLMHQLSNQKFVSADNPPTFIFHTAEDTTVLVQNSLVFTDVLVQHKIPVALHVFPHGRHGAGMALEQPELSDWTNILIKWLGDWVI